MSLKEEKQRNSVDSYNTAYTVQAPFYRVLCSQRYWNNNSSYRMVIRMVSVSYHIALGDYGGGTERAGWSCMSAA